VIIEAGLGGTSSEWVAASYLIAEFAKVYSFDRASHGHLEQLLPASLPLTVKKNCEELTRLLEVAGVEPP
jgi:hypothetical protein